MSAKHLATDMPDDRPSKRSRQANASHAPSTRLAGTPDDLPGITAGLQVLCEFREQYWGKKDKMEFPEVLVDRQTGDKCATDIAVDEKHTLFPLHPMFGLLAVQALFRKCYRPLLDNILTNICNPNFFGLLILTGHPGIGSSFMSPGSLFRMLYSLG